MKIEQLVNQLKDPDPQKRFEAIMELKSFDLPLFEGSDGDERRSKAVGELKQLRASVATLPLIDVLTHDSDQMNRSMAARVLGDYGDLRAIEPLRQCLDESDFEVLCSAINALGLLDDEDSAPRILSFLEESYDKWIRIEAIHAVCNLHYLLANTKLREMLLDPDRIVRYEALQGLVKLNRHKSSEIKSDLIMFLSDSHETNRELAQQWLDIIEKEEKKGNS
jgi:HEAT repeat protein